MTTEHERARVASTNTDLEPRLTPIPVVGEALAVSLRLISARPVIVGPEDAQTILDGVDAVLGLAAKEERVGRNLVRTIVDPHKHSLPIAQLYYPKLDVDRDEDDRGDVPF